MSKPTAADTKDLLKALTDHFLKVTDVPEGTVLSEMLTNLLAYELANMQLKVGGFMKVMNTVSLMQAGMSREEFTAFLDKQDGK